MRKNIFSGKIYLLIYSTFNLGRKSFLEGQVDQVSALSPITLLIHRIVFHVFPHKRVFSALSLPRVPHLQQLGLFLGVFNVSDECWKMVREGFCV